MAELTQEKRKRKPRARHHSIVIAAIEERLNCVPRDDANTFHFIRIEELFDELKRSVNGKEEPEES